jgi:transposase-like protein
MTESKKRKFHPPELKAKVGMEALDGMKTINQIAQEYGVKPGAGRPMEARAPSLGQKPV